MTFDEKEFFRIFSLKHSSSYPGNAIAVEYIVMRAWIENVQNGIEGACKNYMEKELSQFSEGTDYSEFRHVYDIAEDELPRIINLSVLVSIVALYEAATVRLLYFCSRQEGVDFKFMPRASLAKKFNEFVSEKLKIGYEFDKDFLSAVEDITVIRNVGAHGAATICAFSSAEKSKEDEKFYLALKDVVLRSGGMLSLDTGQLTIKMEYLTKSFDLFEFQTKEFMSFIENKYFF